MKHTGFVHIHNLNTMMVTLFPQEPVRLTIRFTVSSLKLNQSCHMLCNKVDIWIHGNYRNRPLQSK